MGDGGSGGWWGGGWRGRNRGEGKGRERSHLLGDMNEMCLISPLTSQVMNTPS